ncbi:MAG: hypothetical protein QXJ75_06565 [Candidatus Bathyarchaeia archaeon]
MIAREIAAAIPPLRMTSPLETLAEGGGRACRPSGERRVRETV